MMSIKERKAVGERFTLANQFSDDEWIDKIRRFHMDNGRIPLKREFNAWHAFKDRFGSWNNAIRLAGFKPNPELFAHKFVASDGHLCDSFSEKVIDDWLTDNFILHERSVRYGTTRLTADWRIAPDILLEFFGLAGVQQEYDKNLERKRVLAKEEGFRLIEVYPKDIYPINTLPALFGRIR